MDTVCYLDPAAYYASSVNKCISSRAEGLKLLLAASPAFNEDHGTFSRTAAN